LARILKLGLLVLAVIGEWFTVETSDGMLSASLIAIVLAMSLLGPVPAAACGLAAMIRRSAVSRLTVTEWLNNLSAFAVFPFVGGWVVLALAGDVHDPSNSHMTKSVVFGLIVFGAFIVALIVNLLLVGVAVRLEQGRSFLRQAREFERIAQRIARGTIDKRSPRRGRVVTEQPTVIKGGQRIAPHRTRLRLPQVLLLWRCRQVAREQLVAIVALQRDSRPARRNAKSRIPRRQPRLHLPRPIELPLQLRQVLRVEIRAIVLLSRSVVIVDEYFHGIRT